MIIWSVNHVNKNPFIEYQKETKQSILIHLYKYLKFTIIKLYLYSEKGMLSVSTAARNDGGGILPTSSAEGITSVDAGVG